jgi:peroxiredoxin
MQLPFPLLSDPERDTYRAYGLRSGKLGRIFGPGTIWAYVKLLASGQMYHFHRSDFLQLGGNFVIDTAGVVRYEYRSGAPHDRPPVDQIIDTLGKI